MGTVVRLSEYRGYRALQRGYSSEGVWISELPADLIVPHSSSGTNDCRSAGYYPVSDGVTSLVSVYQTLLTHHSRHNLSSPQSLQTLHRLLQTAEKGESSCLDCSISAAQCSNNCSRLQLQIMSRN